MIGRCGTSSCIPLQLAGAAASLYEHGRQGEPAFNRCTLRAGKSVRRSPIRALPAKPANGGRKEVPRAAETERSGFAAQQDQCASCEHRHYPDGGWCYMFRERPQGVCMKHKPEAQQEQTK